MPLTLLSQYLPHQYEAVRAGQLAGERRCVAGRRHRSGVAPVHACVPGRQCLKEPHDFQRSFQSDGRRHSNRAAACGRPARLPSSRRCGCGSRSCWLQRQTSLQQFLAPIVGDPSARIVLTGAGTSAFIGQCLQPALSARLPCRVDAIATTDIVSAPQLWLKSAAPTLLVSFARSGNSPESVATLGLGEQVLKQRAAPGRDVQQGWRAGGSRAQDAQCSPPGAARGHQRPRLRNDFELHLHAARRGARVRCDPARDGSATVAIGRAVAGADAGPCAAAGRDRGSSASSISAATSCSGSRTRRH